VKYVYVLQSECGAHFYVGLPEDVPARLRVDNARHVPHTAKYLPWRVRTYVAFTDESRAVEFERYLKSASGRAFASKRF
jgi:putative endonuclease